MKRTIPRLVEAMQRVLGKGADEIGRETGFIKRKVKLSGRGFIQALVFGFQSNPRLTYGELSQTAASIGLEMSAQGLEQRFNEQAATFVLRVLERAIGEVVEGVEESRVPLLRRFRGIYIRDSSVIELPRELKGIWRGNGGNQGENAALKLQVELNYTTGALRGPVLQDGRSQDKTSPFQLSQLPAGSLRLADLGFFNLDVLQADQDAQVYWISRWKTGTVIFQADGKRLPMLAWLQNLGPSTTEIPVELGSKHRIPCRLLIQRVPQAVADQRRRKMREAGRRKRQPVTQERLALAAWTILLTNAPPEILSFQDAFVLLRIRWQVELMFKLWKSHTQIDTWRSLNPWRILCEIYAKLIGVVINQWIYSSSLWQVPERSLFRAAKTIQKFAPTVAITFSYPELLCIVLESLVSCLLSRCRQETRKCHPAAFQLLVAQT